mmetsp:Transcript_34901/g.62230  ORF Transcript_34901/g.62230 Transcript_34901/m.62230 type:complete len:242 (+) Transcript_34901:1268-1993(+)
MRVSSMQSRLKLTIAEPAFRMRRKGPQLMKTVFSMTLSFLYTSIRDCTQLPSRLPTAATSAAAFRGPRPHTNCTSGAIHPHCATLLRSTPTWFTAVTSTCSTVCILTSRLTAPCNGCSGKERTSCPCPQSDASTASGSSMLRPRPTAFRTWSPCSLISCAASAVLAHSFATVSEVNLMSMPPVSSRVIKSGSVSMRLFRTASMSALSCQASSPLAPTTITCGSCCTMKSRTRWASRSLRGF